MNWSDLAVAAIIIGFGLIGLNAGFMLSVFKIASYFLSIWLSFKLYPKVSQLLMNTAIFENIKNAIFDNLLKQKGALINGAGEQVKQAAADMVINKLPLPEFLKNNLTSQIPDPAKLIDITKVMESISGELAKIIIQILSMLLLYISIRIILIICKYLLEGISKLPLFKQIDKLGGFALGAMEGLLTVYIVCAVLMLFNTTPSFRPVYEAIEKSMFAKFFFEKNFIIDFMFPGKMKI
ncbi:MAG TPA: CvpA family protein [Clostridiales bacterium]|nr:CvpA family protein [Clostridiales bacterium]